jgi:cobalamin biosynthesis protein CobD/CbiB
MDKKKMIGIGLMLPLPITLVALILSTTFWVYALLIAVFALLFSYGFKLFKGESLESLEKDIVEDIDDAKEEVEKLKK